MRRVLFVLICCWILIVETSAQNLTVKEMQATNDLSASQYRRLDGNDSPCALIKVQLATDGTTFEGNLVGSADYKAGEYWVYMPKGAQELMVKHPKYNLLQVSFADYGLADGLESLVTYTLTIVLPVVEKALQKQTLTVNYTPKQATVYIDSKPYHANGYLKLELPIGSHNYLIEAGGFETIEGSVNLTAKAPRTLTENLSPAWQDVETDSGNGTLVEMTPSLMNQMGDDYCWGRNGKTQNYVEAVKWYYKAAGYGHGRAQYNLGDMYYFGHGVTRDEYEANKWFRKALETSKRLADLGDVEGQYNMGLMCRKGHGVELDYVKAAEWYTMSANQNYAPAQYDLALAYEYGWGLVQDKEQAKRLYKLAADQGYEKASNALKRLEGKLTGCVVVNTEGVEAYNRGKDYYGGLHGKPKNYAEAAKCFRESGENGYGRAMLDLGGMYGWGVGVSRDKEEEARCYIKAFELCSKAAEQGDNDSMCCLGELYKDGKGVDSDKDKAFLWFVRAAEQGDPRGQSWVGWCYEHGNGTYTDYAEAFQWYNKSAVQGDVNGQYGLGVAYMNGHGVLQDLDKARTWLLKAANQGDSIAKAILRKM